MMNESPERLPKRTKRTTVDEDSKTNFGLILHTTDSPMGTPLDRLVNSPGVPMDGPTVFDFINKINNNNNEHGDYEDIFHEPSRVTIKKEEMDDVFNSLDFRFGHNS